jgi:uncharacterized delta-60 repeat protein
MKTILLILTLILTNLVQSQVAEEWVVRHNGPGNDDDGSSSIAVDGSGNIYVAGNRTNASGNQDYAVAKVSPSGSFLWWATYNGPLNGDDYASAIAVDASGNVYVTGYSDGNAGLNDFATVKFNSSGVQQWAQRYDGTVGADDIAYSIAADASGNVYVTGASKSATSYDFMTIKYNSIGTVVWAVRKDWPQSDNDAAYCLALDASGNVYVTGYKTGTSATFDYGTVKYNSSGIQQWATGYDGPASDVDIAISIAVDASGNSYIAGASTGTGTGHDNTFIKYNSSGVEQWVVRYDGPASGEDAGLSIKLDAASNVYVAGYRTSIVGGKDYTTAKYTSAGVYQWNAVYNGPGNGEDMAVCVAIDAPGNVFVTGNSVGVGTSADFATIKYNSSGAQQWVQRYNGPGNDYDYGYAMALGLGGTVYVAGTSIGSGTSDDITVIKYSQTVGIGSNNGEIPSEFSLGQNYPNPFNPETVIRFQIANATDASLVIYDVTGREVLRLVNDQLEPGTYEYNFSGNRLSSGIYFYTLRAGSFTDTKKMILTK